MNYWLLLPIIFGILFLIEDIYNDRNRLNTSLMAGSSITYFFIVVLPEVVEFLPEYPLHLENFEFIFFLFGFSFIHISEKIILQRVERKNQLLYEDISKKEKNLEAVELNISQFLTDELTHKQFDHEEMLELATTIHGLKHQEIVMREELKGLESQINQHILRDLIELRMIIKLIYHILIGIILVGLFTFNPLSGILFFIFAFFRALLSNKNIQDLYHIGSGEIKTELPHWVHNIQALDVLLGVIGALIYNIFNIPNLEMLYLLFSFVSGIILYAIVREEIPEKEKGSPSFFFIGVVGMIVFVLIIRLFTSFLL